MEVELILDSASAANVGDAQGAGGARARRIERHAEEADVVGLTGI